MIIHVEKKKWRLMRAGGLMLAGIICGTIGPMAAAVDTISNQGTIAVGAEENAVAEPATLAPAADMTEVVATAARLTTIQVKSVSGQPTVQIAVNRKVRTSMHYLSNPDRVLVKIYDTNKTWTRSYLNLHQSPLQRIRLAQHDADVWVVLDLEHSVKWSLETSSSGIRLQPADRIEKTVLPTPVDNSVDPDTYAAMPKASVGNVSLFHAGYQLVDVVADNLGEKTRLTITNDGQARYRVERDKNGQRLQLKFYGAGLIWPGTTKPVSVGAVRRINARQIQEGNEPVVLIDIVLTAACAYSVYKDQNQVVVELTNPNVELGHEKGSLNALVSVDLQNADLEAVLRALAQDVGFDVVLTPDSKKNEGEQALVTITINQQPFKTVLDFILRPRKLAYAMTGNTLRVGLASEFPSETQVFTLKNIALKNSSVRESIEATFTEGAKGKVILEPSANRVVVSAIPSDMLRVEELIRGMDIQPRLMNQTFVFSYTQAEKVLPLIQPLLSALGTAQPNTGENSLVVADIPGNLNAIARMIRSLDTKAEQIMIEARIVEVSRSNEVDLGVDWNFQHQDSTRNPHISASSIPAAGGVVGQITVGAVRSNIDINATLSALESKGKINTLSNPRIATLNKQGAMMKASQNIPYSTSTVSNGVVSNVISYLELPIILAVTPQITKDRQVLLNPMTLTVTTVVGAGSPPPTSTRSAATQMLVSDGETIAIGGMVRDEEITKESKVPLLGDIPLLGALFKSTVSTKNKVELVVFLTTHILE